MNCLGRQQRVSPSSSYRQSWAYQHSDPQPLRRCKSSARNQVLLLASPEHAMRACTLNFGDAEIASAPDTTYIYLRYAALILIESLVIGLSDEGYRFRRMYSSCLFGPMACMNWLKSRKMMIGARCGANTHPYVIGSKRSRRPEPGMLKQRLFIPSHFVQAFAESVIGKTFARVMQLS